jgi:hypothetical protein
LKKSCSIGTQKSYQFIDPSYDVSILIWYTYEIHPAPKATGPEKENTPASKEIR